MECGTQSTDLSITKAAPTSVNQGQNLTYVVTVRNNGTVPAHNVVVTDAFPSPLSFDYNSRDSLCNVSGNTVTCQNFSLNAGEIRVFTLNFTTPSASASCFTQTLSNTASVTSSSQDTNTGNNTSGTVTTTLSCSNVNPAFTISITDNKTIAAPGELLTYIISIRNTSNSHASNVSVIDVLPSQLTFVSASDGGYLNGQTVTWNNLSINANSEKLLTVEARVSSSITASTVITNPATVNGSASASDSTAIVYNVVSTGTQVASNTNSQTATQVNDATTNTTVIGDDNEVSVTTVQTNQNFQVQTVDQNIEQIQYLPVTGIENLGFTAALEDTRAHLTRAKKAAVPATSADASLPLNAWGALSVAGVGIGAVFGRRYFL